MGETSSVQPFKIPLNHFNFFYELVAYCSIDARVSNKALVVQKRYKWTLTEEMIVLALFDPLVPFWMLELMVFMHNSFHKSNTCPLGKPDVNPVILCLNLFIHNSLSLYIQSSKFMASV